MSWASTFPRRRARSRLEQNGVRVLVGDLTTRQSEPGSCALITMYHVVEHLLDPAAYLRAAGRLLQPGRQADRPGSRPRLLGSCDAGRQLDGTGRSSPPPCFSLFRSAPPAAILRLRNRPRKHFSLRDHPAGLATGLAPSLDPVVRAIRGIDGGAASASLKDLLYLGSYRRGIALHAAGGAIR